MRTVNPQLQFSQTTSMELQQNLDMARNIDGHADNSIAQLHQPELPSDCVADKRPMLLPAQTAVNFISRSYELKKIDHICAYEYS